MNSDNCRWYALAFSLGLSWGETHDLFGLWRGVEERSIEDLFASDLVTWESAGLTPTQCAAVARAREALPAAAKALRSCQLAGIAVVTSDDPLYPPLIQATLRRSRPPMLFAAGNLELLREPCVALVGAREALPVSLDFTQTVAAELVAAGCIVVNGFAEGVDQCGSDAALEMGGATVIVLAQGLLTFGATRGRLSEWIAQGRLLALSPFAPRADWQAHQAMSRNAVITALANDVIVAQAGLTGGTWETSRIALRQGKRVWVRHDDDPALGHAALERLGARTVDWPSESVVEWAQEIANHATAAHTEETDSEEWTEPRAIELLRTGSAAQIHEACGLTGQMLVRLVEGRDAIALHTLEDLRKIKGLGPGAVRDIALAFGLVPPSESAEQISLFPAVEEFRGWEASLPASSPDGASSDLFPPEMQGEGRTDEKLPPPSEAQSEETVPRGTEAGGVKIREEGEETAAKVSRRPSTSPASPIPPTPSSASPSPSFTSLTSFSPHSSPPGKNLLLILVSGMRADALGVYGNPLGLTPNLDCLARQGAAFERAYTTIPQDMPARASLLTGTSIHTHGVWANGVKLPEQTPTLATHLAARGYRTALAGKMHLSPYDAPAQSHSRESEVWWRSRLTMNWTGPYYGFGQAALVMGHGARALSYGHYAQSLTRRDPGAARGLAPETARLCPSGFKDAYSLNCPAEIHPTNWVAEQTIRFLQDSRQGPFFIVCSFPDPHLPYAPLMDYLERMASREIPPPLERRDELDRMPPHYAEALRRKVLLEGSGLSPFSNVTARQIADLRTHYFALCALIDDAVGRVLNQLDELGLSDNTLVVFTSDHGDLLGDHGLLGAGPFPYEGLIRVPYLWRLPNAIPADVRLPGIASHIDFVSTVCALIGVETPEGHQGVALDGYLEGKTECPRSAALVEFPSRYRRQLNLKTVVTSDRKMTHYPGQLYGELFDLSNDPQEYANLSDDPARAAEKLEMVEYLLGLWGEAERRTPYPAGEE